MARTHHTVIVRHGDGWICSPIRYTRKAEAQAQAKDLVENGFDSVWLELPANPETGEHAVPHTYLDGRYIVLSTEPVRMA